MADTGKLEKMLILAFSDSEKAENGGVNDADDSFEALINPESYTLAYKLKFSAGGQGQGTSGAQLKYEYTEPEEIRSIFCSTTLALLMANQGQTYQTTLKNSRTF